MDIAYNKVDQTALPIDTTRVSASEYNQIAGSLMNIITSAGLTPDSQDNAQLLNALGPRIVETYSNGTSWYRVYSDGWCEQGGKITSNDTSDTQVIFLKEFADTNYSVVGQQEGTNGNAEYCNGWRLSNLATTSCYVYNATNGTNSFHWRACGYIS